MDLWTPGEEGLLRVITTNPIVNGKGQAVMGRGCALEAKTRFPGLERRFARLLKEHGNRPMRLARLSDGSALATFPVKHHWKQEADPDLIVRSAELLVELVDRFGYGLVLLPRPGCGNGRLSWERDVRPLLVPVLDDRFTIVRK